MVGFLKFVLAIYGLIVAPGCKDRSESLFLNENIKTIYSSAYGNPSHQPIVFIHGGPGHNSYDFELTTARNLAKNDYYVIVYDQRGQGRSAPPKKVSDTQTDSFKLYLDLDLSKFNYKQYSDDLLVVMKKHIPVSNSKKPVLIGHSHGGPIAIQFHSIFPDVAKGIVLTAAPVDFYNAMKSMYENCNGKVSNELFQSLDHLRASGMNPKAHWRSDKAQKTVNTVASMFQIAMAECKLYEPRKLENRARELWLSDPQGKIQKPQQNHVDSWSMPGFIANELYFLKDHSNVVKNHKEKFFGIYADADGLFTEESRKAIKAMVNNNKSDDKFVVLEGPSHNLYWQAQSDFFETINTFISQME